MNLVATDLSLGGRIPPIGEPVWEMALNQPYQGMWSEQDYLALDLGRHIEFSDGCLEFPSLPSLAHQRIVVYLVRVLDRHVTENRLGDVVFAPLPGWIGPRKYREPDIIFLRTERLRQTKDYPHGADLLMEVVSGNADDRHRDLKIKREEYAQALVPEYWIVDPDLHQITVLVLEGTAYREHGVFGRGATATSVALPGFSIDVDAVFAAGQEHADAGA